MSDQPARLRVVGGTDAERKAAPSRLKEKPPRKRTPRQPMKDLLTAFSCAKCSQETGLDQHQIVQVMCNPHEANGKLVVGSLWWACARCLTPYYMIKIFGSKK